MSVVASIAASSPPEGGPGGPAPRSRAVLHATDVTIRSIIPVVLALIAGAVLLLALGHDPLHFYSMVWEGGIQNGSWQQSAIRMAPMLLIAVGLVVIFKANIWNLGYDAQYLLGAVIIAGVGPSLVNALPLWLALTILFLLASVCGAVWTLLPAALKAIYETNEIITTLMMSFLGLEIANVLAKGPFQDPEVNIPQTQVLPLNKMLPDIPGTRVHVGILVALFAAVAAYYVMTRTSFGLRLEVMGANSRAARHVGIKVKTMIYTSFLASGFLIGAAAGADILGLWGFVRSNWNPSYGNTVIPFVFLARLNPLAVIPYIAFFAVLSTGGDVAAQSVGLPTDFMLVLVGLILLFMTMIEFLGRKHGLGRSYLTKGLIDAARKPLFRRRRPETQSGPEGTR